MEERETVVIPEKKEKIEKIKKKYNNMTMSDKTAEKVKRLEILNNILKSGAAVAGIITVVDFFIPDPVLGLDELALTAITGLLSSASTLVSNKIDALANNEDASLQMDEISKLSAQIANVANSVKKSPKL